MSANNKGQNVANAPLLRFPEFKDEWEVKTLKDCCSYVSDRISTSNLSEDQYISTENMLQNFYGVERSNKVPVNTNVIAFKDQDLLMSNIRPYLRKIWLANRNGGSSTDVLVLRAKSCISSKFLFYNLANDNFINHVMAGCKGVKMPRGDKQQILTYTLGISTYAEQQKIANFLSLLDKRIEIQKSAIEKLKSLKSAVVEQMLVCNGTVPRVKYNKFSEKWIEYRLSDILEKIENGVTYDTNVTQGYPVTRIETISSGKINYSKVGYCSDYSRIETHRLLKGDILLSHINSIPYIGKTAYYNGDQPLYHGMNVLLLRCRDSVNPLFFYYMLNTQFFLRKCKILAKPAVNQASISISDLRNIVFKFPSFEEQTQIVKLIKSIDNKIEIEALLLEYLQNQKSYLLSKMFI